MVSLLLTALAFATGLDETAERRAVPFTDVHLTDGFFAPRIDTNRRVTVRYDFEQCERTGRLRNFAVAGGLEQGDFEGIYYNDSDVYKVIEGASYSLAAHPDPELDAYLDDLIEKIAAAQEDDGYLYTIRTIRGDDTGQEATGETRWSYLAHSHELYNVGHLYEAAVAHFQATGKRTLLDVALLNADLIHRVFGAEDDQLIDVPGHEEIEIGLVKLYRVTNNRKYLDLAKFFVDMRGRSELRSLYGPYCQDHLPMAEQAEPVGHAVRAGYLYTAVAEIASLTGEKRWTDALDRIWEHLVTRRLYLTGGMGAHRHNEGFGEDYDLPNEDAYNETCAAIANALWNHRMFLLHGESKYMDVFERVLYNGFLAGVSFSGDRFFYPNPLSCDGVSPFNQGTLGRAPWFNCSCCPVNVVRFLPWIPGSFYAVQDDVVWVNLYASGDARIETSDGVLEISQRTAYPWDGTIQLRIHAQAPTDLELRLRIPGWARGEPLPSDLYRYERPSTLEPRLSLNDRELAATEDRGYLVLRREWSDDDLLTLEIPMPIRRASAHPKVRANRGRVAFERGPLVYCFEAIDNGGDVHDLVIEPDAPVSYDFDESLLGGLGVIDVEARRLDRHPDGSVAEDTLTARAIPYFAWAHREIGAMQVWMASHPEAVRIPPVPTLVSQAHASASHCWGADDVEAINDLREPESSSDHSIPRHTWWDHRGTLEWVQLDLDDVKEISKVSVYWFDDTGRGQCRLPTSWRVLYRQDSQWHEVEGATSYATERDRFCEVGFEAVETDAIRIEAQLQDGFSGGILELHAE